MNENEIIKVLSDLHDKIIRDNCWLEKVSPYELYALARINIILENQKAEIGRLQRYNTDIAIKHYKKFAERLKEKYAVYDGMVYVKIDLDILLKNIDNLVKEMEGDNNG